MAIPGIPDNPTAPHRAILFVSAEIHELLPTGECTGRPIRPPQKLIMMLDGSDRDMAIRKLADALQEMKKLCQ